MLRLRHYLLTTALFLIAAVLLTPRQVQSIASIIRITNSREQSVNLNPTLSDNGRIVVFESSEDLTATGGKTSFHAIRVELSGETPVFAEIAGTRAVSPALSSDGQMAAFASTEDLVGQNADRNTEIFLFDGSTLKQVTHTEPDAGATRLNDGNLQPSLAADGRTIAFASNRNLTGENPDLSYEIFLCDTLAQSYKQLTNNTGGYAAFNPKISADGSRIYFRRVTTAKPEAGDLLLIDSETAITRVLAVDVPGLALTEGRAASNDGMRLVYSAETASNQSQVFIFDDRENRIRRLTQLGSRATDVKLQPTISGDGKRIAFATRRRVTNASDGSVELYVLDLPSGQVQQITNAPAAATAEVVSSLNFDGSLAAFNFPRLLSGPAVDANLGNNSEIYLTSIAARPPFGVATVLNAAAQGNEPGSLARVAPGSIASIRGSSLAFRAEAADFTGGSPPAIVAGTTVRVNGQPARLYYAAPDEVVFIVPDNIPVGPADFVVTNADGFSSKAEAIISATAPGIFTVGGDGRGEGVVLNSDTLSPAPFVPTNERLRLSIFATGMRRATNVSVIINGQALTPETIEPANLAGLEEIHVSVPVDLRGAGQSVLSVTADGVQSNPVSVVIGGSPLRDIMINEFLADPPDGLAGDANHDGVRDSSADEFVELVNSTTRDLDLGGYQLQSRSLSGATDVVRHRFAPNTILAAGTSIVIFGGGSPQTNNPFFGGSQVVKATTGTLSLVNSGGVITVRDAAGAIVTSVSYGSALGLAADQNQSLTRSPDVTGTFSLHTAAPGSNGASYSPGTLVSGDPFLPTPAVSHIILTPSFQEVLVGEEVKFTARAFDVDNRELSGAIFTWNSSASSVLRIDLNGLAKAVAPGNANITATTRGVTSEPSLVIVSAPPTPTPSPTPIPQPSPSPSASVVPSPSPIASPSPSASPTPTPNSPLVISEFRTRGPGGASDEFVELYNNGDVPVDIGGWKIRGSSNNGTVTTRLTINAGTSLSARGHFLATNSSGYSGNVPGDQSYTSGLANDGGVAVTKPDDAIVDQVGLSSGSAFGEGVHLAALASDANQSYERRPGGASGSTQDTNDNFADFQLLTPSDPQNMSSSPTPGPSPLPSPAPSPTATPSPAPTPNPSPLPSPSPSPSASPAPSPASADRILISQIFGGGGNSGAPYRNDFIEIFNGGHSSVSLAGWSVQYASATASTWSVTPLTPIVLSPGQYYLIQEASGGSNGVALPAPDVAGVIAMAATAGKVALVKNSIALTGACPSDLNLVDIIGYGNTANCFRGAAPAAAPANTSSVLRAENGCRDTGNNAGDFTVGIPNPRNTVSPANPCAIAISLVDGVYEIRSLIYWCLLALRNRKLLDSLMPSLADAITTLREHFGFNDFREGQREVIGSILEGKDAVVVMPTGSGKSLCYQLPAMILNGATLVVSPLIALMKDQVDALRARGLPATFINSSIPESEQRARIESVRRREHKLVYVAPERFRSSRFVSAVQSIPISLFAVDEAHCISTWGHDFRPDYLRLKHVIESLGPIQTLALTATATPYVRSDIIQQLGLSHPQTFVSGFDRPNLSIEVVHTEREHEKITHIKRLAQRPGGSGIVYATTRKAVEQVGAGLNSLGLKVSTYHAGMTDAVRVIAQENFMSGQTQIIVATNAFGMGIDKPDIRFVAHYQMPGSIEAYYQEIGRAGRDGLPSTCVLLFNYADKNTHDFFIEGSYPDMATIRSVYQQLVASGLKRIELSTGEIASLTGERNEMAIKSALYLLERAGHISRGAPTGKSTERGKRPPRSILMLDSSPAPLRVDAKEVARRAELERRKLRELIDFCYTDYCYRAHILNYFGDRHHQRRCGTCGNCKPKTAPPTYHDYGGPSRAQANWIEVPPRALARNELLRVRKMLACAKRMNGRFGKRMLIATLRGSAAKQVLTARLNELSTYGLLKDMSRDEVQLYIEGLIKARCLAVNKGEYPTISITELGNRVMREQEEIWLSLPG